VSRSALEKSSSEPDSPGVTPPPPAPSLFLAAIGLALIGAAFTLVATRHGVSVGPDSVTYLSAAHNLGHGLRYSDFTGGPLTHFPPGFPALLAVGGLTGSSLLSASRVINAMTISAIVLLSYLLLRRHVVSKSVVLGALAFVTVTPQLLRSGSHAASDPLFVVLTLAFLIVLEDLQARDGRSVALIVIAALLTWAGFLVRYAGSSLLIVGALTIAAVSVRQGMGLAARRAGRYLLLASIVPALWLLRNATSPAHNFLDIQVQSSGRTRGVTTLAHDFFVTAKHLVFPDRVPAAIALAAVLLAILAIGAAAWRCRAQLRVRLSHTARPLGPILTFIVVYAMVLLGADKTPGFYLDERLLLPMWLPIIVFGAWFVDHLLGAARTSGHRGVAVALQAAGGLVLACTAIWALQQTAVGAEVVYRASDRSSAEVRQQLAQLPHAELVLSNDPWRTYLATGHEPTLLAPMPIGVGFSHRPASLGDVVRDRCAQPTTLVWFAKSPASQDRPASTIAASGQLVLADARSFDGGVVYQIELRNRASCVRS
jgi:hypothetical protein